MRERLIPMAGVLLWLLAACGPEGRGGGHGARGAAAPGSTTSAYGSVPVVFVHGIDGSPADWHPVTQRLAGGRALFTEVYAGDTDGYATGSIPADSFFNFGYTRERAGSPEYYTDRLPELPSIGGCPDPRTDPAGPLYTISYARQLERTVENICRATGSDRIDLVCFSMGGIVGRAYTRWLSVPHPSVPGLAGASPGPVGSRGGLSRVRRLLTIATPNHGVNSLEATVLALAKLQARDPLPQGEAAELNYECTYWSGRSYIDRLNDGWDAFCRAHGIEYAAGYGFGNAIQHIAAVQRVAAILASLSGFIASSLLVHPTPGFDLVREMAEVTGDGDGTVRVASARMDPAVYPGVRFNAPYYGTHSDEGRPETTLKGSTWTEALIRAFILEGRTASGFQASATLRPIDAGGQATWLLVDADATGGEPLAAQVILHPAGLPGPLAIPLRLGTCAYGLLLHPGTQALFLDPDGADGAVEAEVRLYGQDGMVTLPPQPVALRRAGRLAPVAPAPWMGAPTPSGRGVTVPISAAVTGAEFTWTLDPAVAPVASPFQPAAEIPLPWLAPGVHVLRLQARAAANAAGLWVEEARPDEVLLVVDAHGGVTLVR